MKKIICKQMFANAKELVEAVEEMITAAKRDRKAEDGTKLWDSEIDCDFGEVIEKVVLIKETLTDGSHVYNLELR